MINKTSSKAPGGGMRERDGKQKKKKKKKKRNWEKLFIKESLKAGKKKYCAVSVAFQFWNC